MNKRNRELIGQLTGGSGAVGRGRDMHMGLNDLQSQYGIADGQRGGNRRQKIKRAYEAAMGGAAKDMTNRQMLESLATQGGPAPITNTPPATSEPAPPVNTQPTQVGSDVWGNYGEAPELLAKYASLDATGTVGGGGGSPLIGAGGGSGLIQRPTVGGEQQMPSVQPPMGQPQGGVQNPVSQDDLNRRGRPMGVLPRVGSGISNQQAQVSSKPGNSFLQKVR